MLTFHRLPYRSVHHHWRSNLPVVFGAAVAAAVLTGGLLVGDSLRGSLRDRAMQQLNGVDSVYVGPRLVRDELANEIGPAVVPAFMLQGSAQAESVSGNTRRLGDAVILGFGTRGQRHLNLPSEIDWDGNEAVAAVSQTVADHLQVVPGDTILLGLETMSAVPRESLLGRRGIDDVTTSVRVKVAVILPRTDPLALFSLLPNPAPPQNIFVPLRFLQQRLDQPGKVNALLAMSGPSEEQSTKLAENLTLEDWGLRVRVAPHRGAYVTIESEQLILTPAMATAATEAAKSIGARAEPTFVYLANAIIAGTDPIPNREAGSPNRMIPYSTIAGLDRQASSPLGPFTPPGVENLAEDDIVLAGWSDSPLKNLQPGAPVTVMYFEPEMEADLNETSARFNFRGFVPLSGPAADPDLTPPFPGVTDKLTIADWDAPFEINNARIRPRDEEFWDNYRATPKAFISLKKAQELFGSRFGEVTSVRVAPAEGMTPAQTADRLHEAVLKALSPKDAGLRFEATRERLLAASRGGTDFGMLFLGFSFFLILSALLLVGMLFRLAMDRRAREVGILLGTGAPTGRVLRLLLIEGTLVAGVGGLIGLAAAVGFAEAMLAVTAELWPSPDAANLLRLHASPWSFVFGYLGTVIMAVAAVWLGTRSLVRVPVPSLLRGRSTVEPGDTKLGHSRKSLIIALLCLLGGGGLLMAGGSVANPDARAGTFFGGGLLLLAAGLLIARSWLRSQTGSIVSTRGRGAMLRLGIRNAARNPSRTLLTATLIASATFLLVAVESFRRRPDLDFADKTGGSGGYPLIAEADVPIFRPFDREPGLGDLLERLQVVYQEAEARDPKGPSRTVRLNKAEAIVETIEVIPFRLRGGDDASCLNLYQAGQPRVLGVPDDLIQRGGFRFAQTLADAPEQEANPWLLLNQPQPDGAIPIFVEQNTAMWMLKTGVGGTITQPDGDGQPVTLRIVGTVQDSVFQSELLMSDTNFRKLYPREEGYRVFLIDPKDNLAEVAALLETALAANGLTVSQSQSRVAAYQAVIGAYLSTFQLLGGFGLILGVLGLGAVILRAIWERVGELALFRAVGYRTADLVLILLAENVLVLIIGLVIGLVAAVLSVLPNLSLGGSLPGTRLGIMIAAVFVTGLIVSLGATLSVARVPLIPALRKD